MEGQDSSFADPGLADDDGMSNELASVESAGVSVNGKGGG
jgi:hypothetical protein